MSILIDELYTSEACDFVTGQFRGIELGTDNPHKNTSIMLSSVTSKFLEIVEMIPVVKLDSALLKTMFFQIVQQLTPMDIDPVCSIVGGHSSNRKFYQHELCEGSLRDYIVNPVDSSKVIRLSFDPTHIMKCIYNNFVNRKLFKCPDFNDKKVEANFEHVVRLYKSEIGKPIKYAYKLTDKVMTPNGIEKTSVKLADALFHRSTIEGIKVYGEKECPNFCRGLTGKGLTGKGLAGKGLAGKGLAGKGWLNPLIYFPLL